MSSCIRIGLVLFEIIRGGESNLPPRKKLPLKSPALLGLELINFDIKALLARKLSKAC